MRKEHLEILLETIIPKLYGFSYAMTGEENQASQMIVDAYTVFALKEKEFLSQMQMDFNSNRERTSTKRYLLHEMLREIYELGVKRARHQKSTEEYLYEYENFFELNLQKRAVLYLKDVLEMRVEEIQEVFSFQRHQVIEAIHNAYHGLNHDLQLNQTEVSQ